MMNAYRFFLVLAILILVAAGLNTSNQGINRLTMASRPAVIAAEAGQNHLQVIALGQQYTWSVQGFMAGFEHLWLKVKNGVKATLQYLSKIWLIFRVLVFY